MAEQACVFDLRKIVMLQKGVWCQCSSALNHESTLIDVCVSLEKNMSTLNIGFWHKGMPSCDAMKEFIKEKLSDKVFKIQENIIFSKMTQDDQEKICL